MASESAGLHGRRVPGALGSLVVSGPASRGGPQATPGLWKSRGEVVLGHLQLLPGGL